ncbi:MAG: hypothetical protein GY876_09115 [Planctomycetes bacterium]|nr:hypothetical protein [Planctomycetota bacterium]
MVIARYHVQRLVDRGYQHGSGRRSTLVRAAIAATGAYAGDGADYASAN